MISANNSAASVVADTTPSSSCEHCRVVSASLRSVSCASYCVCSMSRASNRSVASNAANQTNDAAHCTHSTHCTLTLDQSSHCNESVVHSSTLHCHCCSVGVACCMVSGGVDSAAMHFSHSTAHCYTSTTLDVRASETSVTSAYRSYENMVGVSSRVSSVCSSVVVAEISLANQQRTALYCHLNSSSQPSTQQRVRQCNETVSVEWSSSLYRLALVALQLCVGLCASRR